MQGAGAAVGVATAGGAGGSGVAGTTGGGADGRGGSGGVGGSSPGAGGSSSGGRASSAGTSSSGGRSGLGGSANLGGAAGESGAAGELGFAGEPSLQAGQACDVQADEVGRIVELSNGVSMLIDAFLAGDWVIIVTEDRIEVVDKQARHIAERLWNSQIATAAFDGTTLVVSDTTEFVAYDTRLREVGHGVLSSPCDTSVLVGNRWICSVFADDLDRYYDTYDLSSGSRLARVDDTVSHRGPMRKVPGRDEFVTLNVGVDPKDFYLLSLDDSGKAMGVATTASQYHGDFSISPVYAFNGNPATQLVTDQGLVLCLNPDDCPNPKFGLTRDGDVGVLSGNNYFGAMDVDAQGKLHALLGPDEYMDFDEPVCDQGCTLERIDVGTGVLESHVSVHFALSVFVALRALPEGGVLLGCRYGSYDGHRVRILLDAP